MLDGGTTLKILIRLNPRTPNKIELREGDASGPRRYRLMVQEGDVIEWEADASSPVGIDQWLVAFMKDEGKSGPPHAGSPLGKGARGKTETFYFRGDSASPKAASVVLPNTAGGAFQFGVTVLGADGKLYLLDPEILVRPRDYIPKSGSGKPKAPTQGPAKRKKSGGRS